MKTAKHGFLNMLTGVLGNFILVAFAFVTPKLVIENYGSEINGLLHSFTQIFTYFSLFEAGVGSASLQALYAPVANKDEGRISGILSATRVFYNRAGTLYFLGVVAVALLYPLVVHTRLPYFFVVGVILFGGVGGCINFIYQGKYILLMQVQGYTYVSTSIDTLCNVLISAAKVVLLLCGCDVLAVQLSAFLISLLRAFIYHLYIRKHYKTLDLHTTPDFEAIAQKNSVLVHQIAYLVFSSTDVLLLTFLTQDLKIVSVYSLYNTIVTTFFTLISHISTGFDFYLGQVYSVDRKKYYDYYQIFEIFHLVTVFSVMTTLFLVLPPFIQLYTAGFSDIAYYHKLYPLIFVMVPLLTQGRTAASSTIVFAGHFDKTRNYAIIETAINLVVTVFGVLRFGIPGALFGTIAASVFRTMNIYWYAYKYLLPGSPLRSSKRWLLNFGIFAVIALINWSHPLALGGYWQIALFSAVTGCMMVLLYGGSQYLLNWKERGLMGYIGRELIRGVLAKIWKRGEAVNEKEDR